MIKREDLILKIFEYIDIPYHHQGRNKFGVDCAGLIVCVAKDLGCDISGDYTGYRVLPDGIKLIKTFKESCEQITKDKLQSGDIILMRFTNEPQHVAFYYKNNEGEFLIHSFLRAKKVIMERYSNELKKNSIAYFKIKEVSE